MISSGIHYKVNLDWEFAVQWWGQYKREEFAALDVDSQARMVAVYRMHRKIEGVIAKQQSDDMKRRS